MREPPRVEQRCGDVDHVARLQRDLREVGDNRVDRLGIAARGALRRPGRARREDHGAALALRRDDRARIAIGHQLVERRVVAGRLVVPGHEALAPVARILEELVELLVEYERLGLLALHDLGQLRAREGGVEVERVGAQLRQRDRRLDEATVVAAHDTDAVTLPEARVRERVRERVRARVHLAVGERAELVDDHRPVRVALGQRDGAGRGAAAPFLQRPQHAPEAVRAHRPDHAGLDQHLRAAQLIDDPCRKALALFLAHLFANLLILELEGQILKRFLERGRHHGRADAVGHAAEQASGRVPGQPQRDLRAPVVRLAQPPAHAVVDPRDAGPRHVGVLVALDDLDQAADVGRPDPHADGEPGAQSLLLVLALEPREAVPEAVVVPRVADELPDLLRRRVDQDVTVDPHQPRIGRPRSSASPVRVVCIWPVTRS